jgi:predicted DsbA family dithiol-disulfide isomerase
MHLGLFRAFFSEGVNIGRAEEVVEVARGSGLDMNMFLKDYQQGSQRSAVLAEHVEAVRRYGVRAIPTVIMGEERAIVGAVPFQEYDRLLTRLLG